MTPAERKAAQQAEAQRAFQRHHAERCKDPALTWHIGQPDGSVRVRIGPGPDRPEAHRN